MIRNYQRLQNGDIQVTLALPTPEELATIDVQRILDEATLKQCDQDVCTAMAIYLQKQQIIDRMRQDLARAEGYIR